MTKIKTFFNLIQKILNINTVLLFMLTTSIFFLDRLSKIKIINYQLENSNIFFVNKYLNFELVWNTGIGFGILNLEANIAYHSITLFILVVILLLIFFMAKSSSFEKYSYSLVLGGAIGNFYDRIIYYAVPDFIDFHVNNYHWFTFNIADIFITIGIILLVLNELIFKKYEK